MPHPNLLLFLIWISFTLCLLQKLINRAIVSNIFPNCEDKILSKRCRFQNDMQDSEALFYNLHKWLDVLSYHRSLLHSLLPANSSVTAGRIRALCELLNPNVSELLGLGKDVPIKMKAASQSLSKLDSNRIYLEWTTFTKVFSGPSSVIMEIRNQEVAYQHFQLDKQKKNYSK